MQYYYAGPILVAKKQNSVKTWYHSDRLGSIRLMTNVSGVEVKDYDYKAFGDFQSKSGTEFNERTFTGHISDAETGLIYMGARYYDAALGRFISADTIIASLANPQSLNRYSYVYNNPINNTDPTGHRVCDDVDSLGRCINSSGSGTNHNNDSTGNDNTDTNKPGGSNRPANQAKSTRHTGGGDFWNGGSPETPWHEHITLGTSLDYPAFVPYGYTGMKSLFKWGDRTVYAGCIGSGCTTADKYHLSGRQAYRMEQETVHAFADVSDGEFLLDTEMGVLLDAGTLSVASPAMGALGHSQTQTSLNFYDMLHGVGEQDVNAGKQHQPLTIVVVKNTFFFNDLTEEWLNTQRTAVYIEYGSNQVTPPMFANTWSGLAQNIDKAATAAWIWGAERGY